MPNCRDAIASKNANITNAFLNIQNTNHLQVQICLQFELDGSTHHAHCVGGLSALRAAPCCRPAPCRGCPWPASSQLVGRRVDQQSEPLPCQLSHRYWHSTSLKQRHGHSGRVRTEEGAMSQEHQMSSLCFVKSRIASTQPTSTVLSRQNVGLIWIGGEGAETQYGIH